MYHVYIGSFPPGVKIEQKVGQFSRVQISRVRFSLVDQARKSSQYYPRHLSHDKNDNLRRSLITDCEVIFARKIMKL